MGYDIGPRLRKYREVQNLSQKAFAGLIGVSNSRVSNWEQGINRPDVDILAKICEVLKVSPSELLDISVLTDFHDAPDGINRDDEVKQLVKQYGMLSEADRKLVQNMVKSLAEKVQGQPGTGGESSTYDSLQYK